MGQKVEGHNTAGHIYFTTARNEVNGQLSTVNLVPNRNFSHSDEKVSPQRTREKQSNNTKADRRDVFEQVLYFDLVLAQPFLTSMALDRPLGRCRQGLQVNCRRSPWLVE